LFFAALLLAPRGAGALTIEEAWQAAEENNPTLQLQREIAVQTGTQRGKAYSALSPRVDAKAAYVLNSQEIAFDPGADIPVELSELMDIQTEPVVIQQKRFWQGEVGVSQRLFNGTAVPLLNAAYNNTHAANAEVADTRQQIRATVAQAYFGLLTSEDASDVAAASLETAEHQLALAVKQRESGLATERATLQGEIQLAQARRTLAGAEARRVEAMEAFARTTGIRDVELSIPPPLQLPADLDEAIKVARYERADIQAVQYRSEALFYNRAAKDLQWLPTVEGRAAYHYDENLGFADKRLFWRASVQATWSLWDGGLRLAERKEIASQIRANRMSERVMADRAEEQIRVAWHQHQRATEGLATVDKELGLARRNAELAELQFQTGQATWLDVEQAQLSLRAAEFNTLTERMNQYMAAIQIRVATGTL
jgi:outer membrane protein TolC